MALACPRRTVILVDCKHTRPCCAAEPDPHLRQASRYYPPNVAFRERETSWVVDYVAHALFPVGFWYAATQRQMDARCKWDAVLSCNAKQPSGVKVMLSGKGRVEAANVASQVDNSRRK